MSHKNATKKLWGSFFDILCQINGDFFPKMWGFLKKCLWGSKVGIFSGGVGILSLNLLATLDRTISLPWSNRTHIVTERRKNNNSQVK